jgi:hypothetical protein
VCLGALARFISAQWCYYVVPLMTTEVIKFYECEVNATGGRAATSPYLSLWPSYRRDPTDWPLSAQCDAT